MEVRYNEKPPRFYGYAYDILEHRSDAYYLFPFNHIVGICYVVWHKIRHAKYVRSYLNKFEQEQRNDK